MTVFAAAALACAASVSQAKPLLGTGGARANATLLSMRSAVMAACPGFSKADPLVLAGRLKLSEVSWNDPDQGIPLTKISSELWASGTDGTHTYKLRGRYAFGPGYLDLVLGSGTTRVIRDDGAKLVGPSLLAIDPQADQLEITWPDRPPTCTQPKGQQVR